MWRVIIRDCSYITTTTTKEQGLDFHIHYSMIYIMKHELKPHSMLVYNGDRALPLSSLRCGRGRSIATVSTPFAIFLLFLDSLHQFVELSNLLVWPAKQSACIQERREKERRVPLILSSSPGSILPPCHVSPSTDCAYHCHLLRKPTCGIHNDTGFVSAVHFLLLLFHHRE